MPYSYRLPCTLLTPLLLHIISLNMKTSRIYFTIGICSPAFWICFVVLMVDALCRAHGLDRLLVVSSQGHEPERQIDCELMAVA